MYVDVSSIMLGEILAQLGEGSIDYTIALSHRKLSSAKKNYTMIEWEGLSMVYALQKFWHYLLGGHFKMFTNHSTLKYFVIKPVLGERSVDGYSSSKNSTLKLLSNVEDWMKAPTISLG